MYNAIQVIVIQWKSYFKAWSQAFSKASDVIDSSDSGQWDWARFPGHSDDHWENNCYPVGDRSLS